MLALLCIFALAASPISSAAGPRLGPIQTIEVAVSGPQAFDALVKGGYDVGNVSGNRVTLYATPDEVQQLRKDGFTPVAVSPLAEKAYQSYDSIVQTLQNAAADHPEICRLRKLGTSVTGRDLWAVLVTNNPDTEEDEPEFKYAGSMHGDEPVGAEMCLRSLDLLLTEYGSDDRIATLVDTTALWILPVMNPDGFETISRYNANGFDLNRSFPIYLNDFTESVFREPSPDLEGRPPEVVAVAQWTLDNSFVLSANFHSGSLVVNYPYDDDGKWSGIDAPTPDDALFRDIARRYSVHNEPMWSSTEFPDGITNGNTWYTVRGGMQDWNYRYAGCNEVTIELSTTKNPAPSALDALWADNKESMLSYAEACHIGVRGLVTDSATGEPLWAEVRVAGIDHPVYTDPDVGDYHRMLLPGEYSLRYAASGYTPRVVTDVAVSSGEATRVDVELTQPDVNGDGVADAADVQRTINAILGISECPACDLDGGGVTSTDLQILINVILDRPQPDN